MTGKIILCAKLSFLLAALVGCGAGQDQTNVELFQEMMDQKSLKAQDYDEFQKQASNRMPPEGTVPRGHTPYQYKGLALEAEAKLMNPYANDTTEKFLARGQEKYRVYCGVCHGVDGNGDGTVAPYLQLKAPPVTSDKVKAFRDGRIYHIITDGQGLMSSYATQIHDTKDRWAIVNYIRVLQKK